MKLQIRTGKSADIPVIARLIRELDRKSVV